MEEQQVNPKQKAHIQHVKLELTGARVHVWVKFRAKDTLDAIKQFDEMSDRTPLRLIREGQARTRVMDAGTYVCWIDDEQS